MPQGKNKFIETSELDRLKVLFYTALKKELKTFNVGSCSDQFLKGIENGIIEVATRAISEKSIKK